MLKERKLNKLAKQLYSLDEEKRILALKELGEMKGWQAAELILMQLHDHSDIIRVTAIQALGKAKNSDAVDPLIRSLGDLNGDVRRAAAGALEEYGEIKWKDIIKGDDDDYSRLGKCEDPRAVWPLIAALGDDYEWFSGDKIGKKQYIEILNALGELRNRKAVKPLSKILSISGYDTAEIKAAAAEALGKIKDPEAVK